MEMHQVRYFRAPCEELNFSRAAARSNVSYLERINCEFGALGDAVFSELGVDGETVYRSDRDDWVLAMAAAGLGYAFMPRHLLRHHTVRSIPLVEPQFWREVNLVTVRGRRHSPAVGALVQIAMKTKWLGSTAIAMEPRKPGYA